ncbi:hypothetical protein ACI2KR_06460 [Pseudomonas luteola]
MTTEQEAITIGEAPNDVSRAKPLTFGYTNYRGEYSVRNAIPSRIYFGATDYHPEPQWLMEAHDLEKGALRVFAMNDIGTDVKALRNRLSEANDFIKQLTTVDGSMINGNQLSMRAADVLKNTEGSNDLDDSK